MSQALEPLPEAYHHSQRDRVFISYSHKDKKWLDRLQAMLKPLVRNDSISVWDDTKVSPGALWRNEIADALAQARVVILLVSPSFLASDFIISHELHPALQTAASSGLTIFWVCLEPCLFEEMGLTAYQAVHDPDRPLSTLRRAEQDSALVKISRQVRDQLAKGRRHLTSEALPESTAQVELTIGMELSHFNEKQGRLLQHAIAGFLEISPSAVRITSVKKGSVKVTLELPKEASDRLLDAFAKSRPNLQRHLRVTLLDLKSLSTKAAAGASAKRTAKKTSVKRTAAEKPTKRVPAKKAAKKPPAKAAAKAAAKPPAKKAAKKPPAKAAAKAAAKPPAKKAAAKKLFLVKKQFVAKIA